MNPTIILIGGVPCVGKSTITLELAYRLKIKQIVDLDSIREALRGERTEEEDPYLFKASYTSWEVVGFEDSYNVIESFENYCGSLKKSLKRLIDRAYVLGKSTIIEGVHIIPSFVKEYLSQDNVKLVMLSPNTQDIHMMHFNDRKSEFGMDIKEYVDQMDKISLIDKYLVDDAIQNNCTVLKVGYNDMLNVAETIAGLIEQKSCNACDDSMQPISAVSE